MKTALITGGNSGIGFATAKQLKQMNYDVHIVGKNSKTVTQASKQLQVHAHIADLSNIEELKELSNHFTKTGLDLLVNNAGIATPLPLEEYTLDNFDKHININLRAPLMLIHYLLPALEKKQGCVVNISSIITHRGAPGFAIYAATKGALEAMTKNLALELSTRNIRVNAVAPGAIDTPIFDKFGLTPSQSEQAKQHSLSTIPMGRMGTPEEVAQVIISQAHSSYVTGAVWTVDGGVNA